MSDLYNNTPGILLPVYREGIYHYLYIKDFIDRNS